MEQHVLERMVAEGLTIKQMAARLESNPTAVRAALNAHKLETDRTARRRAAAQAREVGLTRLEVACRQHGVTAHCIDHNHGLKCLRCRSEAVVRRRRKVKQILIEEAGGACLLCGYARSPAALAFHHVDPSTKAFSIAGAGVTRSLERAREEARKCVLLCANCHAEVEVGYASLSSTMAHDPG